jgi:hypothetical protein
MSENNESGGKTRFFCVFWIRTRMLQVSILILKLGWDAEWNACCNDGKMEDGNY